MSRLVQQMERTTRAMFRPQTLSVDTATVKARATEIELLMAELVEDRAAVLLDRAALLAGTETLREELAGIRKALRVAEGHEPLGMVDAHEACVEFHRLDPAERRAVLQDAFAFIQVVPRGKGRPKAGQATWRADQIKTDFTPAWSRQLPYAP